MYTWLDGTKEEAEEEGEWHGSSNLKLSGESLASSSPVANSDPAEGIIL